MRGAGCYDPKARQAWANSAGFPLCKAIVVGWVWLRSPSTIVLPLVSRIVVKVPASLKLSPPHAPFSSCSAQLGIVGFRACKVISTSCPLELAPPYSE